MSAQPEAGGLPRPSLQLFIEKFGRWIESDRVQKVIVALIILNGIILGLETVGSIAARFGPLLSLLDELILYVFVVEVLGKLAYRRLSFFRNGWNVFDFVIVGVALLPASGPLAVLRVLRILRVLRLLRVVSVSPSLRRVVEGFIRALPGMGSVFLLMGMLFYIGAVMSTKLFGASFPDWFGDLGNSAYSLFQIMTLESWSMGIVRPVMEVYPYAWAFFVPFILVTTFAVVNLLVGLIVNSMQDAHNEESDARTDEYRDEVLTRLRTIEARLERGE